MDHRTIGDIITSNIHRRCLHEHVENIADVSPMCLGHFEPWCISPNARRCSAIYHIADGSWRRNFSRCPDALVKHGGDSRTSPIIRRTILVHGGAAMVMPKFEHRESIGRLIKPRGTVALYITITPPTHRRYLSVARRRITDHR